jgi:hypothetical protein
MRSCPANVCRWIRMRGGDVRIVLRAGIDEDGGKSIFFGNVRRFLAAGRDWWDTDRTGIPECPSIFRRC